MAYVAKETNVVFVPKNDKGDFYRVARVIPERGLEAIDIRAYFTNEAGERCPTSKGVRFHSETFTDVIHAVLEALTYEEFNTIMDLYNNEEEDNNAEEN